MATQPPPGFVPEATDGPPSGFNKDITRDAASRRASLAAPQDGPSATKRFLQGLGVPMSVSDVNNMMPWNRVANFAQNPTFAGAVGMVSPALGAAANGAWSVPASVAEGDYAGAAGKAAGTGLSLVPTLGAGFKDAGVPIYADTPPPSGPSGGSIPPIVKSGIGIVSPRLAYLARFGGDLKDLISGSSKGDPIGYNPRVSDGPVGPQVPPNGLPTGVNKPAVNSPINTQWAGQPSSPPLPANGPAMDAYSGPPPYSQPSAGGTNSILNASPAGVTRAAITQNTALTTPQSLATGGQGIGPIEGSIPTATPPMDPNMVAAINKVLKSKGLPELPPPPMTASPADQFSSQALGTTNQAMSPRSPMDVAPTGAAPGSPVQWLYDLLTGKGEGSPEIGNKDTLLKDAQTSQRAQNIAQQNGWNRDIRSSKASPKR